MAPIKVHGRFATTHDTARTLGVSASRTKELIARVREYTERIARRDSNTGEFTTRGRAERKATMTRKGSRRNAHATVKKATSKRLEAAARFIAYMTHLPISM